MTRVTQWQVDIYFSEEERETHAEARLATRDTRDLRGYGRARCNPADPNIPEIGEELAASRALSDLAHRLLNAAATDIEAVTHEAAELRR